MDMCIKYILCILYRNVAFVLIEIKENIDIKYQYMKFANSFHSMVYPKTQERKVFFQILLVATYLPLSLERVRDIYWRLIFFILEIIDVLC